MQKKKIKDFINKYSEILAKDVNFDITIIYILSLVIFTFVILYNKPEFLEKLDRNLISAYLNFRYRQSEIIRYRVVGNYIQVLTFLPLSLVIISITPKINFKFSLLSFLLIVIIHLIIFFYSFELQHSFNLIITPTALLGIYSISLFLRYKGERKRADDIGIAFAQYVNPQILNTLLADPKSLELGGQVRNLTVLFTDIRNFSAISEQLNAKKLVAFLNSYFNYITKTIISNKGTIDKYIGDTMMAFWNAPLKDSDHAYRSCTAALDMVSKVEAFNKTYGRKNRILEVAMGIGINSGKSVVGNVGSKDKVDYTVLGDEVNVASRLESLTKIYRVPIIIGENTVKELIKNNRFSDFSIRLLDMVKVKGKEKSNAIYELMGHRNDKQDELSNLYTRALLLYTNRKFNQASEIFVKILGGKKDHPSKMMLVRCYQFIEQQPKDDWDGSWEWEKK